MTERLRAATAEDAPVLRRALILAWRWREQEPADADWRAYLAEERAEPLVGFVDADGVAPTGLVLRRPLDAASAR